MSSFVPSHRAQRPIRPTRRHSRPLLPPRHIDVVLTRPQTRMPQQHHDLRRRSTILRQPSRERMPQRMHTRTPRHPIMQPRPPKTRRHQILQRTPTNRLTPPIPHQQRRPTPTPQRKTHPTRRHITIHNVRQHRLNRNRPIPRTLTPHMQPLLTPTTHQRPHRQPTHLRRPQTSHQTQRHHQHIPLRPRIPRPTTTRRHRRQQLLRRVLTPQRLGGGGHRTRPRHPRHRIPRQPPLRHTEHQELIPRRPRPRHRTTRMPIREHTERHPQRRRRQHIHRQPTHRHTQLGRQQPAHPSQIPPISRRRMRRILPRPPSHEERLPSPLHQHKHWITHTTDTQPTTFTRPAQRPWTPHRTSPPVEWLIS